MGIGTYILVSLVKILIAVFILLTAVAYTTLVERKVVAHMQNRWGPHAVGPFGIWQPLADGLKFIFKEDLTPPYVNKPLYLLAPIIALTMALTSIAVIPVGPWITFGCISTPLTDHRRKHRAAHDSGHHVDRRLRQCTCGLVIQQQVFDAGQPARLCANGQL